MIKANGVSGDGKTQLYLFGLSAQNCANLMMGRPIHIKLSDMGGPPGIEITIIGGLTEEILAESLKPWIGPHTEIKNFRDPHR